MKPAAVQHIKRAMLLYGNTLECSILHVQNTGTTCGLQQQPVAKAVLSATSSCPGICMDLQGYHQPTDDLQAERTFAQPYKLHIEHVHVSCMNDAHIHSIITTSRSKIEDKRPKPATNKNVVEVLLVSRRWWEGSHALRALQACPSNASAHPLSVALLLHAIHNSIFGAKKREQLVDQAAEIPRWHA